MDTNKKGKQTSLLAGQKHAKNILDWYKMGIATKLRKIIKKEIIKKKKKDKTKRQIPRYRISILTRTANAVQYPTH